MYSVILDTALGPFLSSDKSGAVSVFTTQDKTVEYIKSWYEESDPASSCLHNLGLNPTVVQIPDQTEELQPFLNGKVHRLNSVSGTAYGWPLKPEKAKELLTGGLRVNSLT